MKTNSGLFSFCMCFVPLAGVGIFNGYADSLWLFSHKNKWNNVQFGFNERQQNELYNISSVYL